MDFLSFSPFWLQAESFSPAIDLYQNDDEVVVKAALPGLKADDVQISITADVLTLRGEFKEANEQKETNYHIREQRFGSF